jgi:hypothetical protein
VIPGISLIVIQGNSRDCTQSLSGPEGNRCHTFPRRELKLEEVTTSTPKSIRPKFRIRTYSSIGTNVTGHAISFLEI